MDSGAFEQNGFSVDLINACRNSCEASHNTSIEVNNQFHLSDGIWLPLLLSFHCTVARERQNVCFGGQADQREGYKQYPWHGVLRHGTKPHMEPMALAYQVQPTGTECLKAKRQHQSINGGHSQCEPAHIAAAICIVHADGWEMSSRAGFE